MKLPIIKVRSRRGRLISARQYAGLANALDLPCEHAHFGCAAWEGGPCSDELLARQDGSDRDELRKLFPVGLQVRLRKPTRGTGDDGIERAIPKGSLFAVVALRDAEESGQVLLIDLVNDKGVTLTYDAQDYTEILPRAPGARRRDERELALALAVTGATGSVRSGRTVRAGIAYAISAATLRSLAADGFVTLDERTTQRGFVRRVIANVTPAGRAAAPKGTPAQVADAALAARSAAADAARRAELAYCARGEHTLTTSGTCDVCHEQVLGKTAVNGGPQVPGA